MHTSLARRNRQLSKALAAVVVSGAPDIGQDEEQLSERCFVIHFKVAAVTRVSPVYLTCARGRLNTIFN